MNSARFVVDNSECVANISESDRVASIFRLDEESQAVHERDPNAQLAKHVDLVVSAAASDAQAITGHGQCRGILRCVDEQVISTSLEQRGQKFFQDVPPERRH
jgi:hypothetical protein